MSKDADESERERERKGEKEDESECVHTVTEERRVREWMRMKSKTARTGEKKEGADVWIESQGNKKTRGSGDKVKTYGSARGPVSVCSRELNSLLMLTFHDELSS